MFQTWGTAGVKSARGKKGVQRALQGQSAWALELPAQNHTRLRLTLPLGPSAHSQDMAAVKPSLGRVLPRSSMLFLCDMQEKFRHIAYFPQIVSVAARMLKVQDPPPSGQGSGTLHSDWGSSLQWAQAFASPHPRTGGPAAGGASRADGAVPTRPGPHSA